MSNTFYIAVISGSDPCADDGRYEYFDKGSFDKNKVEARIQELRKEEASANEAAERFNEKIDNTVYNKLRSHESAWKSQYPEFKYYNIPQHISSTNKQLAIVSIATKIPLHELKDRRKSEDEFQLKLRTAWRQKNGEERNQYFATKEAKWQEEKKRFLNSIGVPESEHDSIKHVSEKEITEHEYGIMEIEEIES